MTQADIATTGHGDQTFLVIGAVRTAGRVQGKVLQTAAQSTVVMGSEPLLVFFEQTVVPFFRSLRETE